MEAQAWAGDRYVLTGLTDDALLAGTRRLAGTSNQLFADLLAHLAEVEARGVHRLRLCVSLYTYCIYELRFSEDAAFRRVSAARLVKTFPVLFDAVASGELHLTGLLMLGPHLTQANHVEVLALAKHRTKKEIATLIRRIDPLPDVPARIEPLGPTERPVGNAFRKPTYEQFVTSLNPVRELPPGERPRDWIDEAALPSVAETPLVDIDPSRAPSQVEPALARKELTHPNDANCDLPVPNIRLTAPPAPLSGPQRYAVRFTVKDEYVQLVERAKALLSHRAAGCSIEELHLRAMQALVAQLEKRRYAVTDRPATRSTEIEPAATEETETGARGDEPESASAADTGGKAPRQRGRHVPASIRRVVYARDEARCTHVDASGSRCRETHCLELHHVRPFAMGGSHSADNLTLRCRVHNALSAEHDFGRAHMDRKRIGPRHGRASFARER